MTEVSNKDRGGRLCVYVNNSWCTNTETVSSHCSLDLELVTVKCRPIYPSIYLMLAQLWDIYITPLKVTRVCILRLLTLQRTSIMLI